MAETASVTTAKPAPDDYVVDKPGYGALPKSDGRLSSRCALLALVMTLLAAAPGVSASGSVSTSLFDVHLHYNEEDAALYTPKAIAERLVDNGLHAAAVTSRPPELALQLHAQMPEIILPVLGVYRTPFDKGVWTRDPNLPKRVEQALADDRWRAIGELHLFAEDRHRAVFSRVVELATSRGLPLLMHCDPVVIDTLFEKAPDAKVIWAHAGAYPYPPLLRDYLERYSGLYIDLSVRDSLIAPQGQLDPEWEWLLLEHSDRFMIGVDTYRTSRWHAFSDVVGRIRHWLDQLPDDVSNSIASANATRLFRHDAAD